MYTRILRGIVVVSLVAAILIAGTGREATAGPPRRSRSTARTPHAAVVTVIGDNQPLPALLQQVMTAAHANFTIDAGLAESYCTVKLKNVPVMVALDALARSCTRPFTYQFDKGIYHFAPTGATNLDRQRITLDIQNSSLPGAISAFMRQAHGDYILDRDIGAPSSMVTMSLTSVPFPTALDSLIQASSVPITYRIESSATGSQVYHFMSRAKAERKDDLASGKIKYTDESLEKDPALAERRVTLDFEAVYLSHVLKTILDRVPLRYEIDASVSDAPITQHLENIPLAAALKLLVKTSGQPIVYHFENDVLRFTRAAPRK